MTESTEPSRTAVVVEDDFLDEEGTAAAPCSPGRGRAAALLSEQKKRIKQNETANNLRARPRRNLFFKRAGIVSAIDVHLDKRDAPTLHNSSPPTQQTPVILQMLYFSAPKFSSFTHPADSAITRTERKSLNAPAPTALVPAFDHQDEAFSKAFSILKDAIEEKAFPASSIAVTSAGKLVALKSFGTFTFNENAEGAPSLSRRSLAGQGGDSDVTPATLFDLASLTKVVATTTMAAILYERGLLELDAPVVGTIPEFLTDSCGELDPRRQRVTCRMLLSHSSGLPAYEKLFLQAHTRDDLLRAAFTMPLSVEPATRPEYSDIGFIILGAALERIAEEPLADFCQRQVFGPLAMSHTTFNPPTSLRLQIPPTADERETPCGPDTPVRQKQMAQPPSSIFRNRIIQGEVQDENAYVLGGAAPHAGLFSTAEDLAHFAHAMLQGGNPILRSETVALFTRRESVPTGTSRALGWDTPSTPSQSGKHFGPRSYGHLGYTGTSLWIDPDRQLSITLLTNRTWPNCANQAVKEVRPRVHDAVIEALDLKESEPSKLK